MKEFRQLSTILWKRNRIWIIIVIALFLLSQSIVVNNEIKSFDYNVLDKLVSMDVLDELLDSKENLNENTFQDRYYTEVKRGTDNLKRQYPNGLTQNLISEYESKFKALSEKVGYEPRKDTERLHDTDWAYKENVTYNIDRFVEEQLFYFETSLFDMVYRTNGFHKIDITQKVFIPGFGIFLTIFIVGFLLTSLEHLTPYYEFTRMLPWSNTKTYFSKLLFGGTIVTTVYLISAALKYGLWKGSFYGNIIGLNELWSKGLICILIVLGFFFIVMSLGTVSGNILGHIGMLIIGFAGIQLWIYNLLGLSYVILGDLPSDYWIFKLIKWINQLPDYIQVILTPGAVMDFLYQPTSSIKIIACFAVGVVFLILGWFWTNTNKSEKSGMLLMKKPISLYAQAMAVITTSNLIYLLFRDLSGNRILSIASFLIGFLLSYLFYKKLFNVRIGI